MATLAGVLIRIVGRRETIFRALTHPTVNSLFVFLAFVVIDNQAFPNHSRIIIRFCSQLTIHLSVLKRWGENKNGCSFQQELHLCGLVFFRRKGISSFQKDWLTSVFCSILWVFLLLITIDWVCVEKRRKKREKKSDCLRSRKQLKTHKRLNWTLFKQD